MRNFLFKDQWGLRLLALLLAFLLWVYVYLIEPGRVSLVSPIGR